jgi:hypothetical protein
MGAFEHVMTLVSFVFALAIAHLLSCVVALIRAQGRVRYSFAHSVWLLNALFQVLSWWLSFWDYRAMKSWDVGTVTFTLAVAILIYVYTGLVCPEVPKEGPLDLNEFHDSHRRQYIGVNIAIAVASAAYGAFYGFFFHIAEQFAQMETSLIGLLVMTVAYFFRREGYKMDMPCSCSFRFRSISFLPNTLCSR